MKALSANSNAVTQQLMDLAVVETRWGPMTEQFRFHCGSIEAGMYERDDEEKTMEAQSGK